ncbi:MAG: NADH:flavin oxidoreductase [Asgard group archaeon]|nr:NADH:flavin oxidoreductase [Asgard group archaeon]
MMVKLFDSYQIKNFNVNNRLMRSATTSYWSDEDGVLRQPILDYYKKLAKGGIGFIIKGHSYVVESGKAHTGQSGLTNDKHIPKMKKLTDIVHDQEIQIIAQINHGGYTSKADRATASYFTRDNLEARELSIDEIESIVENFASAAEIAMFAGFDGVQIHGAHGYLVSQFLSDNINKRQDSYGGSLENRAKILIDIFNAIKKKIGNAPIISIKMNCDDFAQEGGIQVSDAVLIANWLDEKGIDLIEISGGGPNQDRKIRTTRGKPSEETDYFEANFSGHAETIRKAIPSVPLGLVDGFRTRKAMDAILAADIVDMVSIAKPTIIEPDFPNKLRAKQKESACIDCRECVSKERFGKMMLSCAQRD